MNKNAKAKAKIPVETKNFRISTRIVISSVLAIVIPLVIISLAAGVFVFSSFSRFDYSATGTESYNILNQVRWSQAVGNLMYSLTDGESEKDSRENIERITSNLESFGSLIYIEKDGAQLYSTVTKEASLSAANSISPVDLSENLYYYGEEGLVIVSTQQHGGSVYTIVASNSNYASGGDDSNNAPQRIIRTLTSNAVGVMAACVLTFVLAIIILSVLTSKTIIDPIEKITRGANEIANGNLDYEIDYQSTNELGQLARSFNDMRLRVKESIESKNRADQQQKEMIAGIAHDLRTPLTSIKGYLEGIRDGVADTPEKRRRYLDTIYDSALSMEKLLNDLLTLSKLELGTIKLNRERVRISDFMPYASELGEELEKEDFDFIVKNNTKSDPALYIDTDRFSRVVTNIISNSLKYRRPGIRGRLTLTVSEYEQSVIFEIADNGTGVDPKNLPRLFDTLYREDKARSNVRDGSGLGLSVCRQIVELHGGMIWAQINAGGGLSVFISLPKNKSGE